MLVSLKIMLAQFAKAYRVRVCRKTFNSGTILCDKKWRETDLRFSELWTIKCVCSELNYLFNLGEMAA